MKEWYSSLSILEYVYFYVACIATFMLVVQIILMCVSSVDGDLDLDGDGVPDVDTDSGISIFTFKSLTAFFAVGGWAGLLACSGSLPQWISVIIAFLAGGAAMALVAVFMRFMVKLQCNGALETDKLVGKTATVYVSVPPMREGRGKITLNAQGRYVELDAVTESGERLKVDETVVICAAENECMVVKRVTEEKPEKNSTETA